MNSRKHETVADIVAEIRGSWAQVYFCEGSRRKDGEYCDNEFVAIESEAVADRIEAALERERARAKSIFVYAIQIYQGRWRIFEDGFSSPDEVKEYMNTMRRVHPRAEFRIVRHPAMLGVCWEVVK